ncbi:MAG: hypothetical protein K0S10_1636 [Rubrobacteraceae bacterium]|jgi:hypothetical protein|nr:hypothetical protein [Rubrobacteraceae bacterium]
MLVKARPPLANTIVVERYRLKKGSRLWPRRIGVI